MDQATLDKLKEYASDADARRRKMVERHLAMPAVRKAIKKSPSAVVAAALPKGPGKLNRKQRRAVVADARAKAKQRRKQKSQMST